MEKQNNKYTPDSPKKYDGKLREHSYYYFDILKIAEMPEGEKYYVFRDPFGARHLVPVKYYAKYNLKVGERTIARVDKISCAGEVYIEPNHPDYEIGAIHNFKFVGHSQRVTKDNKLINVLMVEDSEGNTCTILPNHKQKTKDFKPDTIPCKITRIKKGKLYLLNMSD